LSNFKRILIIQTAYTGDVILITPLIRATKGFFPDASIDVLVIPQTKDVLVNNPYIDNLLTFDKRKNKIIAFWKTVQKIKNLGCDLAISPHSSTTTAYLMLFSGIKERLGFDRWHASRYLTLKIPHLDGVHKVKKNLHLLSIFSDQNFSMQTELFPCEREMQRAGEIVNQRYFNNRPTIAIAPGSVWFTKRWREEHYINLTAMLFQARFNLIFIGSKQERLLCETIIQDSHSVARNFAGEMAVLESAAVVAHCDLLVCNDSGALHIANAMKTDVFAFFGPTVQSMGYFPYRENDVVFERDMDCRPCGSHGGKKCPLGHHRCMKEILPENVFQTILERFQDNENQKVI
jgi:heptosyltransferase-2